MCRIVCPSLIRFESGSYSHPGPRPVSAIPRLQIRISRTAPAGMGLVSAFNSLADPGITLEARLSRLGDQIQGRSWPKTLAVLP